MRRVLAEQDAHRSDETSAGGAKEFSPALQRWAEWE